jgi:hypothetical protein
MNSKKIRTYGSTAGLLAAGVVAGGVLAGSLTANASTGASSAATPAAASSAAPTAPSNPNPGDLSKPQRSDETLLTGDRAAKVKAAVLAKYPKATIQRLETDSDGVYEAHILSGGVPMTVKVGSNFAVTGTQTGGRGCAGGPGRPDGPGGPGGPGRGPSGSGEQAPATSSQAPSTAGTST